MKRAALVRRTPLGRGTAQLRRSGFRPAVSSGEAGAAGRRIRHRTPKRSQDERAYSLLRKGFLLANPYCAVCGHRSEQVHHRIGREGWRLLAVEWWLAVCASCHLEITVRPAWAIAQGWSESRLANRETAQ